MFTASLLNTICKCILVFLAGNLFANTLHAQQAFSQVTKPVVKSLEPSLETVIAPSGTDPDSYRSPKNAVLYSLLLPGGGQYYTHYYLKGTLFTTSAGGAVTLISLGATDTGSRWKSGPKLYTGIALLSLTSLASMFDAYISARAVNSRNGYGKLHTQIRFTPSVISIPEDPGKYTFQPGGQLSVTF